MATDKPQQTERDRQPPWRLAPLLLIALAAAVLAYWQLRAAPTSPPHAAVAADPAATVELVIESDHQRRKAFGAIPWRPGMTVADALRHVQQQGRLNVESIDLGGLAMVEAIDRLKNQGSGAEANNWFYSVNGQPGQVSYTQHELEPGDRILWTFTKFD